MTPVIVKNPGGNSLPGHPPTVVTPPSHVVPAKVPGQGFKNARYANSGSQARTHVGGSPTGGPTKMTPSAAGASNGSRG